MKTKQILLSLILSQMLACTGDARSGQQPYDGPLIDLFVSVDSIVLDDPKEDPIGDISFLIESRNDEILVADAIIPRVRRFDRQGRLLSEFGKSGEGPTELRRVTGLVKRNEGIAIADSRLARVTIVDDTLAYQRTLHPSSRPTGRAERMGSFGSVAVTSAGARSSSVSRMTDNWAALWSVQLPTTYTIWDRPYWGGVSYLEVAAGSDVFAMASSVRYPIYLLNEHGHFVDSLTSQPPSFREIPIVEEGWFTGPSAEARQVEWLASFDVMTSLTVVQDQYLVVTHGHLSNSQTARFEKTDTRIDVYRLDTREKVAEDVALPKGARILGGGDALYISVSGPPDPWVILRARFGPYERDN